jgi:hypothetical protein
MEIMLKQFSMVLPRALKLSRVRDQLQPLLILQRDLDQALLKPERAQQINLLRKQVED